MPTAIGFGRCSQADSAFCCSRLNEDGGVLLGTVLLRLLWARVDVEALGLDGADGTGQIVHVTGGEPAGGGAGLARVTVPLGGVLQEVAAALRLEVVDPLAGRLRQPPLGARSAGLLPAFEENHGVEAEDHVEVPAHGILNVEVLLGVGVRDVGVEPHLQVHLGWTGHGEPVVVPEEPGGPSERREVELVVATHGTGDVDAHCGFLG
jgi:hypothetical protein